MPEIYTDSYFAHLAALEGESWWTTGMREVLGRLLALAPLPARGVALDVGCGTARTLRWVMDERPGWRGAGVDIEAAQLARAARLLIPAVRADAAALPVRSASVDLALALDVLNHLPLDGAAVAALGELHRVVRPGGVLLVRTGAQAFPYMPPDREARYTRYRPPELSAMLRHAGFRIVRLSRVNALLGLAEIPRELQHRRERARGEPHRIVAPPPRPEHVRRDWRSAWLGFEGWLVASGFRLPAGRSLIALCLREPATGATAGSHDLLRHPVAG